MTRFILVAKPNNVQLVSPTVTVVMTPLIHAEIGAVYIGDIVDLPYMKPEVLVIGNFSEAIERAAFEEDHEGVKQEARSRFSECFIALTKGFEIPDIEERQQIEEDLKRESCHFGHFHRHWDGMLGF